MHDLFILKSAKMRHWQNMNTHLALNKEKRGTKGHVFYVIHVALCFVALCIPLYPGT